MSLLQAAAPPEGATVRPVPQEHARGFGACDLPPMPDVVEPGLVVHAPSRLTSEVKPAPGGMELAATTCLSRRPLEPRGPNHCQLLYATSSTGWWWL